MKMLTKKVITKKWKTIQRHDEECSYHCEFIDTLKNKCSYFDKPITKFTMPMITGTGEEYKKWIPCEECNNLFKDELK